MMKTFGEIKDILKKQKPFLKEKYGVSEIGIFGCDRFNDIDVALVLSKELNPYSRFKFAMKIAKE